MRALIIEPEMSLADYLVNGLTASGFVVDVAGNAIDGLHLGGRAIHLVVLTERLLGSPFGASDRVASEPALLGSPARRVLDRFTVRLGADDRLAKPFAYSEFLARASALLRRAIL